MKLIIGLGNPGKEYERTRHNVGFMAIDNYLGDVEFKKKDNYLLYEKKVNNEKYIFIKPITYMNESGLAVRKVMDYYKIALEDILVIYDDMDFDLGQFKIKKSGSSAGHNGIKSIISHLNTDEFKRVRIGISKVIGNSVDYVLGNFSSNDMNILKKVFNNINNVIDDLNKLDFEKIMSKYN